MARSRRVGVAWRFGAVPVFTWEVPLHLYLNRAIVLNVALGSADAHAAALAARL